MTDMTQWERVLADREYQDKEIDRLSMELDNTVRELADMKDKYDRLRGALEAYANKNNWHRQGWVHVLHQGLTGPSIAIAALKEVDDDRQ